MKSCYSCRHYDIENWPCDNCSQNNRWEGRAKTNEDVIRSTTREQLAGFLVRLAGCPLNVLEFCPIGKCVENCKAVDCWLEWLKQEASE